MPDSSAIELPVSADLISNMRPQHKFTFIPNDPSGLPRTRRQTRQACERCRRAKRRCTHHSRLASQLLENPSPSAAPKDGTFSPNKRSPEEDGAGDAWFVGNMDPKGAFLIAARPATDSKEIRQHGLGVWLPAGHTYGMSLSSTPCSDPVISILKEQCLGAVPSQADMQELLQIYIENIHPIFPIVDVDAYQSMPPTSAEKILLSQSICMAVSRERKAKPHLCLVTTVQATANGFSQTVSSAAATLIDLGIVRDKLVLIQAMSLTSLFTQFSGDRQEPAELLSRAICHAHTIGLHHECRSSLQQQQIATRVFCCLYALDILNSACLGRPVQLHRRDFGRDLSKAIAAQDPCFCLFLQVIQLMDRVIEIYRPGENGVWKGVFPSFEDLVGGVDSSDIPMHLIATVEVLYHAVAILSCHSTNLHGVSRTGPHSSDSNIRQTLSASRVPHIVGEEFLGQLSLFPFVPYTVALALRSSYHNLQQSRTLLFQERAKKQFVLNCAILRELGGDFYSALLMAELGERLIKGLEDQREQEQCQAQSGRGGEGQGQRQELFCGDNAVLGGSEDVWDQGHGTPTLHNSMEGQTQVRTEDTGVFDPMSFFGIFDDFEHEIESFAGVPSL